jgi:hypothetical protein
MAIVGAYFWWLSPFWAQDGGGEDNSSQWTADWNIPPSSVLAISSLSHYWNDQMSGAEVGYLSYTTQNPDTGVPSEHTLSPSADLWSGGHLTPSFSDDNVIIVTGAWSCFSDGEVEAMGNFTVFVWG